MISSENYRQEYDGNGIATVFAYGFPVTSKNHVKVVRTVISTLVDTVLVVDVDYTVNGVSNVLSSTWTVTLGTAPTSLQTLTIVPNLPLKQLTDYENQGGYFAQTHEDSYDYLTILVQQLKEITDRAVLLTVGSRDDGAALTASILTAAANATAAAASAAAAAASATSVNIRTINSQAGDYTVIASDRNKLVDYTGAGGHTFAFTAAATLATGFEFHVKNSGSGNVTLDPAGAETVDGSGTVVLTPGQAVVVVGNGTLFKITQARGYGVGTGTVTSVDATQGVEVVAGVPITNAGTIRGALVVRTQTTTADTVLTGDRGKLVTHSNVAAIAVTLPQASATFPANWFTHIQNRGAGTVTITPTTSTIDGAASLAILQNQGALIVSDGTNYFTMRGGASVSGIFTKYFQSAQQVITQLGTLTIAHGLGAIPKLIQGVLVNITGELGYTPAQELMVHINDTISGTSNGAVVNPDATNLNVKYGNAANGWYILDFSTGNNAAITNANWRFVIRAAF